MTSHKTWLDNEYGLWVKALQESTVHNFKDHPMVKRMLSEVDKKLFYNEDEVGVAMFKNYGNLYKIYAIGETTEPIPLFDGRFTRMIYYALEVLKRNPASIVEIGGGVGQFYAILRALGYRGEYYIADLPEVREFQKNYLREVEKQTGLPIPFLGNGTYFGFPERIFCVSFYALGEFDDELKKEVFKIVNDCGHGYIAWNAHSGASDDLSLFTRDIKVTEGREENIKIIQW